MSRRSLAVYGCAVGLLALAALVSGDARADELKEMQGTWKVVEAQVGGAVANQKKLDEMKVVIDGNKFTLVEPARTYNVHFLLDSSANPQEVDFYKDAKRKEKLWLGIYDFDGKEMNLCWASVGGDRPKEFEVKKGTDQRYFVIRKK
jgi:uncharacterized protein (TIGR03067 family)